MDKYQSDFSRIVRAAQRRGNNQFPLYEHNVSLPVLDAITGADITGMTGGTFEDRREGFRLAASRLSEIGYDTFAFEGCITELVQGGKGLMGQSGPLITSKQDLDSYPWDELPERYFQRFRLSFEALREALPPGMKAVGGVGNGLFELIQDFVPLTDLAYLEVDQPAVFAALWKRVADVMRVIWERFLQEYGDIYCLCRFGDDLGFNTSLLLKPSTVTDYILPQYQGIVDLVHRYDKPFLLHSCGAIFSVMDQIIEQTKIDAKHSNEDSIAPFTDWVERYGERIGLFGGIDMNILCSEDEAGIRSYVGEVLRELSFLREHHTGTLTAGIALGSGNQIADYVPPEHFLVMVEALRELQ
ncbi:MAG: uroporphyrinogen decarboxylase family protein [Spirochaetota bacterium]